jgi:hypothetical protein
VLEVCVEDVNLCYLVGGRRCSLRDDRRGQLAVGLGQIEDGAAAGWKVRHGGDGADQINTNPVALAGGGRLDDIGAAGDGTLPSVPDAGFAGHFFVVGSLVDDKVEVLDRDGCRRAAGVNDGYGVVAYGNVAGLLGREGNSRAS